MTILPKTSLKGKSKPQRNARTNKHKKKFIKEETKDMMIDDEEDQIQQENTNEIQDEEMNAEINNTENNQPSLKEMKAAKNLKSKEEKAAIREARRKKNLARNLYKIRSNYCSGKNGPRAINRGSNF